VFLWLTFLTALPVKASLNIRTDFVRKSVVYIYGGDAAGPEFGFAEAADDAAERACGMRQTVVRRVRGELLRHLPGDDDPVSHKQRKWTT
jgi:hypothetical protein